MQQRRRPQVEVRPTTYCDCGAFKKNLDGSWIAVKQTRVINPAGYELMIPPKMTFRKGKGLATMGFDVVEFLEQNCK